MNKVKSFLTKCRTLFEFFVAFICVNIFGHHLKQKNIWLISEKMTEARDNGYHLFLYLRKNHPQIPAYYVIEKDSSDYLKVSPFGNIVFANTFRHFFYYLCARYSISSQGGGAAPEPKRLVLKFRSLVRSDQNIIFLQHGIIQNEIPHGFDYEKTHYSLFVCSSSRERDFIETIYHYPPGIVKKLGLCRFDNLHNSKDSVRKQVLIMPTFRRWLISKNIPNEATNTEKTNFINSNFYQAYRKLLLDERLQKYLRSKMYVMVFYPHYAMQSYINCFSDISSDVVIICDRMHYDVQQLLIESACLITDYSSIFFDFAYMEKPEMFYQFDEAEFRAQHYKKGYFDYKEDGFGPVFKDHDRVVDYIIKSIESGCKVEDKYVSRIGAFFDQRDKNNCERNYDAILQLENE